MRSLTFVGVLGPPRNNPRNKKINIQARFGFLHFHHEN